jgi:hypothetical protein
MTAQHPREPAPCGPAVDRRSPSGGALRAARLAGFMALCSCYVVFYRGLSVLSPGLPCSHQRVEPTTPCTAQGGLAVHAVLQGGRCLPHPPDYGPTTPVSAACGAGVTGAPGTHPCTVMPLLTWGAGRGAGARMPRYRRRGRSNLRPACALERPQGPGPGMSPGCVQCALIALFVYLQLYLGLFGVTRVAACLGRLVCACLLLLFHTGWSSGGRSLASLDDCNKAKQSRFLVYHVPTSGSNPRPLALLRAA